MIDRPPDSAGNLWANSSSISVMGQFLILFLSMFGDFNSSIRFCSCSYSSAMMPLIGDESKCPPVPVAAGGAFLCLISSCKKKCHA